MDKVPERRNRAGGRGVVGEDRTSLRQTKQNVFRDIMHQLFTVA
jgi:hypothetical protein